MVPMNNLTAVSLLLVLASPALGFQASSAPKQADASTTSSVAKAELKLHLALSGLTEENSKAAKTALMEITVKEYSCPECRAVHAAAGQCEACETELVSKMRPVFQDVKLTPREGESQLALQLATGRNVRLTQVESALKKLAVTVSREKLPLDAGSVLIYQGGASKEDASSLQTAFKEAQIAIVHAEYRADSKEIQVRLQDGKPTWLALTELGSKRTKPLKLTDVMWGTTPVVKS